MLDRGLGRPHLANLRRDLGFEPCGYGNDVVTAGRLVSCLGQHARPWYHGARKVTSPPPHYSDILPVVFQMDPGNALTISGGALLMSVGWEPGSAQ